MPDLKPQTKLTLDRLRLGFVSPIDAIGFGCSRLAARVLELKKAGYHIEKQICRTESGKHYARYHVYDLA